jgi:predicted ArsR family transcriptional regulator
VEDRWSVAAALFDTSRRALYDYVRRQDHPVTREEAAQAQQMSRGLAAFHLDKLVEAGLLRAFYQAPAGRPRGRGRPAKVYEPTQRAVAVTIPERRYELIAQILADTVAEDPADVTGAARRHAHQHGRNLGTRLRAEQPATDLPGVLQRLGFEPRPDAGGRLLLHNCPFHELAVRHTTLVCTLNHAFLAGLVDGLAAAGVRPDLSPQPGACCVVLVPEPPAQAATVEP